MAKTLTKQQLVDENIGLRHNLNVLEQRLLAAQECYATAQAELEKLTTAVAAHIDAAPVRSQARSARPIYEFNPNVPGDFKRAAALARANGGSVQRARVQ